MGRVGAQTGGLSAELYALTHRGNVGDLAFYRSVCRNARSVLELGSGYGRVLRALARTNRRLVGLELDPALLALARRNVRTLSAPKRKGLRLVNSDMRDFEFDKPFDRVLLPYNALYCLLTERAALACFRAARRASKLGGRLSFDVWNAEGFQRRAHVRAPPRMDAPIVTVQHARRTWDVFEQLQVRRAAQRLLATYHYVPRGIGLPITLPIAQRYFSASQIDSFLERSGFLLEARFGDFGGAKYSARSPHQVVIARAI